jgi:hypothetical protein
MHTNQNTTGLIKEPEKGMRPGAICTCPRCNCDTVGDCEMIDCRCCNRISENPDVAYEHSEAYSESVIGRETHNRPIQNKNGDDELRIDKPVTATDQVGRDRRTWGKIMVAFGLIGFFSYLTFSFLEGFLQGPPDLAFVAILPAFFMLMPVLLGLMYLFVPRRWFDRLQAAQGMTTQSQTIVKEVVLVTCRHCGARYRQGTPKCLTCGANL